MKLPTKAKRFVLEAHCSSPHVDLDGYDCFVVTIDPAYARILLKRVGLFKAVKAQNDLALELYFWDACGAFHARDFDAEDLAPSGEPSRTECNQLVVDDREIFWTAIPKHTDLYVTTDAIPLNEIKRIAGGQGGPRR